MSHMIKCPHCGKPAVSLAFVRDETEHKAHVKEMKATDAAMAIRIDDAGFSNRVRRSLESFQVYEQKIPGDWNSWHYRLAPVRTLGDLCLKTEYDLGHNRLGRVSRAEINAILKAHGLYLGMTKSDA